MWLGSIKSRIEDCNKVAMAVVALFERGIVRIWFMCSLLEPVCTVLTSSAKQRHVWHSLKRPLKIDIHGFVIRHSFYTSYETSHRNRVPFHGLKVRGQGMFSTELSSPSFQLRASMILRHFTDNNLASFFRLVDETYR